MLLCPLCLSLSVFFLTTFVAPSKRKHKLAVSRNTVSQADENRASLPDPLLSPYNRLNVLSSIAEFLCNFIFKSESFEKSAQTCRPVRC